MVLAVTGEEGGAGVFNGCQRAGHGLQQLLAGIGQRQAMRIALEQGLAEVRFEPGNGTADRALGHAQVLGRARETAQPRGGGKGMQFGHRG